MRAEVMLLLALGAAPALAAQDASLSGAGSPSPAFLEFLGGLVELEGELLGPQDLEAPSEPDADGAGEGRDGAAARPEEDQP